MSHILALLKEPPEIQQMFPRDNIGPGHIKALHAIEDESQRTALATQAAKEHWNVRQTEHHARAAKGKPSHRAKRHQDSPTRINRIR